MLFVRDIAKLKDIGFETVWGEKNIYRKKIESRCKSPNGVWAELVVNPLGDNIAENEILLYVYADTSDMHGRTELEILFDCEEIFEMLAGGIIKYVPKEVAEYGKTGTDG